MGCVRPASVTSEAIEAEVLLKVWDVLHLRVVGESEASGWGPAVGLAEFRSYWYDCDSSLLHSNFQSWQMRSLPTLDRYRILLKSNSSNVVTLFENYSKCRI